MNNTFYDENKTKNKVSKFQNHFIDQSSNNRAQLDTIHPYIYYVTHNPAMIKK